MKSIKQLKLQCNKFINQSLKINDKFSQQVQMGLVLKIFFFYINEFPKNYNPTKKLIEIFKNANLILSSINRLSNFESTYLISNKKIRGSFEDKKVAKLFSEIWPNLSNEVYYNEPFQFTKKRFLKSGFNPFEIFKDKVCLDAGCGSGKFSIALKKLGAKKVIGIDLGERGLKFARKKLKQKNIKGIFYKKASLLNLPFQNKSFDLIWSNGVIHHTSNYEKCIKEFSRVLKKDGTLFLYVSGRCGLYEILQDTLRKSLVNFPKNLFIGYLRSLNINSGRIYWITDSCFAPYNWKSEKKVIRLLKKYNFDQIKKLKRGLKIDHIEQISSKVPFAQIKYGEGQLKFLARLKK